MEMESTYSNEMESTYNNVVLVYFLTVPYKFIQTPKSNVVSTVDCPISSEASSEYCKSSLDFAAICDRFLDN